MGSRPTVEWEAEEAAVVDLAGWRPLLGLHGVAQLYLVALVGRVELLHVHVGRERISPGRKVHRGLNNLSHRSNKTEASLKFCFSFPSWW